MRINCPNCTKPIDISFDDQDEFRGPCPHCQEPIDTSLEQIIEQRRRDDQERANNLVSTPQGRKRRYRHV